MRFPAWIVPLSVVALALALAGCTSQPTPPAPAPEATAVVATPSLLNETWMLQECDFLRTTLQRQPNTQQQDVPEEYDTGSFTGLLVQVVSCESLATPDGPVAPFSFAMVSDFTQLPEFQADGYSDYLHEAVVSDAAVADRLAAFGLPVVAGTVEMSLGQATQASFESEAGRFAVTVASASTMPNADGETVLQHQKVSDERYVWVACDQASGTSTNLPQSAATTFSGGYVAKVYPAGAMAATTSHDHADMTWTFGEHRTGA